MSWDSGFWSAALVRCSCLGDVNRDGVRDGIDIGYYVDCIFLDGNQCQCADFNESGGVGIDDLSMFTAALISDSECS